jgi:hypothetical protein
MLDYIRKSIKDIIPTANTIYLRIRGENLDAPTLNFNLISPTALFEDNIGHKTICQIGRQYENWWVIRYRQRCLLFYWNVFQHSVCMKYKGKCF